MNSLPVIACGIGLQEGLNPCIFMACAFFIAHGLWLAPRSIRLGRLRFMFALAYLSGFLEFNFGFGQILTLRKEFFYAAKIIYFVLGVWALLLGLLFIRDWFLLHRGMPEKDLTDKKIKPFAAGNLAAVLITLMLAMVLSALSTLVPINMYIMVLCNISLVKGMWKPVASLLASYAFFNMWPLWFVWAFLTIKNMPSSTLRIFFASIFLTASTCMIFIFK